MRLWLLNQFISGNGITSNIYASGGLSSPIDEGSFTEKQRQEMLLQTFTDRRPIQTSEKKTSEEEIHISSSTGVLIPPSSATNHSQILTGDVTSRKGGTAVGILGATGKTGNVSVDTEKGSLAAGVAIDESASKDLYLNATVGTVTSDGGSAYGVIVGNTSMFLQRK